MKYWIRGTLFGLLFGVILIVLAHFTILEAPPTILFNPSSEAAGYYTTALITLSVPTLIISLSIGAIIGLIVGKIKRKNSKDKLQQN